MGRRGHQLPRHRALLSLSSVAPRDHVPRALPGAGRGEAEPFGQLSATRTPGPLSNLLGRPCLPRPPAPHTPLLEIPGAHRLLLRGPAPPASHKQGQMGHRLAFRVFASVWSSPVLKESRDQVLKISTSKSLEGKGGVPKSAQNHSN